MPSRRETILHAVQEFNTALHICGTSPENAWLGIYTVLLWYEPTNLPDRTALPHIIDADKLRRVTTPKKKSTSERGWIGRAISMEKYLSQQMGCLPSELEARVNKLMKRMEHKGLQRQNPLGIAFTGLIHHVLTAYGNPILTYEMEQKAGEVYPGITFPDRSKAPSIDVLVLKHQIPRAIVSMKWSLRHDRINDLTNECPTYKQAAQRLRQPLAYVVVTNEYDPSRLHKILDDTCIDAVVHVHKPVVTEVLGLDGRLNRLLDLTELFALTEQW